MVSRETFTMVFVTTQFEGFHRWKDAPPQYGYLKDWHRHMFHVRLRKKVDASRQIEFIELKQKINAYIDTMFKGKEHRFELSCEELAEQLLHYFNAHMVEVSEDGENGAIVFTRLSLDGKGIVAGFVTASDFKTGGTLSTFVKEKMDECAAQAKKEEQPKTDKAANAKPFWEALGIKTAPYTKKDNPKRDKIFFGIEAEGPRRGDQTIFIPGTSTVEDYMKVHNVLHEAYTKGTYKAPLAHFYMGAGDLPTGKDPRVLAYLMEKQNYPPKCFTIEIESIIKLPIIDQLTYAMLKGVGATIVSLDRSDIDEGRATFYKSTYGFGKIIRWERGTPNRTNYCTEETNKLFDQDCRPVLEMEEK